MCFTFIWNRLFGTRQYELGRGGHFYGEWDCTASMSLEFDCANNAFFFIVESLYGWCNTDLNRFVE